MHTQKGGAHCITFLGVLERDARTVWKAAACILPIQLFYAFMMWFPETIGVHAAPLVPRLVGACIPPTIATCLFLSRSIVLAPAAPRDALAP